MNIHWKDWYWSWNSSTLATWCEELTHCKRPWCWKRLKAGEEGDDRGWDGWIASPTWWTWVWVGSGNWWWTGKPGVLQPMGSQRVGHDWATGLNCRSPSGCTQGCLKTAECSTECCKIFIRRNNDEKLWFYKRFIYSFQRLTSRLRNTVSLVEDISYCNKPDAHWIPWHSSGDTKCLQLTSFIFLIYLFGCARS